MIMGHDPETPIQDADIETGGLIDAANHADRLRQAGICPHGAGNMTPTGGFTCADCGKTWATFEDMLEDRADILG